MGNLNIAPETWLDGQFLYEYCAECGGDAEHHEAIEFMGNWFARCKYPPNEEGLQDPVIQAFRAKIDEEDSYVRGSCPVCGGSVDFHAGNCTELML